MIQKPDGSLTDNDFETACVFNEFFSSVFTVETNPFDLPSSNSSECVSKLSSVLISPEDVSDAIKRLKPDSSPGPDEIPNRLIIESRIFLSNSLADFFNLLLSTSSLPSEWKEANIVPIHKSGSFASPNNYRPVSLTSSICKIFERILHRKILAYVQEHKLLNTSQHGFLPRKSCLTALLESLEIITDLIDSGKPVDVLYLDFRKAFDSVPHQRLLTKLKSYGIVGPLL